MSQLENLIKDVMEKDIAEKTPHAAEIKELINDINANQESIEGEFVKIGKLYYKLHSNVTTGELGALISGVKASEDKIKDDKVKIGELLGFVFCAACGGQVDDDALFCNNCGARMPVKLMPGMVLCKHCNKAVREGISFCTNCGKSMKEEVVEEVVEEKPDENVKTCPNCGWETTDMTYTHCPDCGRKLEGGEPEEEKKEAVKVKTHKVCPRCGFKVFDAETTHCDKCGTRLDEDKNA